MNTLTIPIKDIQMNAEGNLVIICPPSKINEKGAFVMSAGQTDRILQRTGIPNAISMKHLVALTNGTSKLTIDAEIVKPGDVYTKKDGSTGTYEGSKNEDGTLKGDGSWTKLSNHNIDLGFAAKQKVADIVLNASFSNMQFGQRTQQAAPAPAVAAVASTEGDAVPNV